jgi:hypothetical protein
MTDLVPLRDRRAGLGPPRFGLGTLLLLVTACCVVLASYTWIGAYGATLVGLFVVAVLAHVAANWLGTQLRDIGDRVEDDDEPQSPVLHGVAKGNARPQHNAPASHLGDRIPLHRGVMVTAAISAAVGGAAGSLLVWLVSTRPPTWPMLICGGAAFAALAAMWSFLVAAFVQSGWKALTQATRHK